MFFSVCLNTFEELNFKKLATCPECRSVNINKDSNIFLDFNLDLHLDRIKKLIYLRLKVKLVFENLTWKLDIY
jgi:hypothetical protein